MQYAPTTVLQTISNSDGSVSIIQVDPNNPVITLPDGTLAHIANFEAGQPGVHTLAEVASVASEQREQQQQQQAQLQAQQAAVAAAAQQQQIATTTTTALEINGEMASEGTILIAGEDGIGKEKYSCHRESFFIVFAFQPIRSKSVEAAEFS